MNGNKSNNDDHDDDEKVNVHTFQKNLFIINDDVISTKLNLHENS